MKTNQKLYRKMNPLNYIKKTISENLENKNVNIFLFGSRAKKNNKINSDYDIWILSEEKIPTLKIAKIRWILKDSPRFVDIVDFKSVNKEFKENAMKNLVML